MLLIEEHFLVLEQQIYGMITTAVFDQTLELEPLLVKQLIFPEWK